MVAILSILLMFFISTMSCNYVLEKLSVKEPLALALSIIFGILCAIFLSVAEMLDKF